VENIQYTIRMTEVCNRSCAYCHYHSDKSYSLEDSIKTIDLLFWHSSKVNKKPWFYIHGGEPTRSKHFKEIIDYIKSKGECTLEVQTNFDDYKKIIESIKNIDLLSISFHYPNKISDIDLRLRIIKSLKEKIFNIDLVYIPEFEEEIKYIREFLNESKIHSEITYNFFEAESYEKNILESGIELNDKEIEKNNYFNLKVPSKGILCDTSNYSIINLNGEIFKCSEALTYGDSLGNILEDKQLLFLSYSKTICNYDFCGCELSYLKDI